MANDLDLLTSDIQQYIVSPLNAFGLGGFVFDVEGEALTSLEAEITDHYTEDNKAVQDHIARKPKKITLKGYVGELVYNTNSNTSGILQTVTQKLTELTDFLPQVSTATAQIQSAAVSSAGISSLSLSDTSDIYALVQNVLGSISSDTPRQQQAYMYFKACWEQGILMGIQTPWEFLTNMAIESVTAIQTEQTKYVTDFAVRYKQMRFAQTLSAAYNTPGSSSTTQSGSAGTNNLSPQANQAALQSYRAANGMLTPPIDQQLQGAAALQAPDPVSIGNIPGVSLPSSLLAGSQSQITQASDMFNNPGVMSIFQRAVGQ